MTMYTAPPNQDGLVLGDGDVLQVNSGGTATDTIVDAGGEVIVEGGTAVNTILDEGREYVYSGVTDGVTFGGSGTILYAADPASIHGTLTFDEESGEALYEINFGTTIKSISFNSDRLTVNYGANQSVTYNYKVYGNAAISISGSGDTVQVILTQIGPPAGHSSPGLSGSQSLGLPGHFQPEPFVSNLNHLSTPVIGLLHHLGSELHL
jgi:autotransporter passenger strand-loop-strand repeat protein